MKISEIRRADANGKQFVISVTPSPGVQDEWLSASSEAQYNKWLNSFKNLQEQFKSLNEYEKKKTSKQPDANCNSDIMVT